jgi:hypothetical protein
MNEGEVVQTKLQPTVGFESLYLNVSAAMGKDPGR